MAQKHRANEESDAHTTSECFVFDACAFIAYFNNENGADKVEELLEQATRGVVQLFTTSVNVYEVYYDALRSSTLEKAEELLKDIYDLPLTILETIDRTVMRHAGRYKTTYQMSLADSFILAYAKLLEARVVTTDHHEFDNIDKLGKLQFCWLR